MRLIQLAVAQGVDDANAFLVDGWQLITITDQDIYHFGRYEVPEPPDFPQDWREYAREWLSTLDIEKLEMEALNNLSFDSSGTKALVVTLCQMLDPEDLDGKDEDA